jgi:hypothetical protein
VAEESMSEAMEEYQLVCQVGILDEQIIRIAALILFLPSGSI